MLDWTGEDEIELFFEVSAVWMNSGIESFRARKEIFRLHPEVKRFLWGGKFWASGYYVNSVGQYANEEVIKKYLQNQGKSDYEKLHSDQLRLF